MKRRAARILFFSLLLCFRPGLKISTHAQNVEGQVIASQFGEYQVWGSGTNRFTFTPTSCQVTGGGRNFSAFARGVPVLIADPGNSAIDETVSAGLVNIQACSVQLSPVHKHSPPFYLTSGTGGLQEAINANLSSQGANTIILSAEWYRLGGSAAIIATVKGTTSLRLEDVTTTPATWYQWNGSTYLAVSGSGGVGSINGMVGPVTITSADSNITVSPQGSNIQIGFSGPTGISSINGDDDSATQSIVGTGGVSCSTVSGRTTCNYAGSAGSGAVATGGPYNDSGYTPGTLGTTVGQEPNTYILPLNLTASQISGQMSITPSRVQIQTGDADTPFTNPHANRVVDNRIDHPAFTYSLKDFGAQANLGTISGSLSGTTLTSAGLTSAIVGRTLVGICNPVSGVQTIFEGKIVSVTNSTTAVTTGNPGSVCVVPSGSNNMEIGQDDTAAVATAIGLQTSGGNAKVVLTVPAGRILTHTITAIPYTLLGLSTSQSQVVGFPCESVFNISGGNFQDIGNFTIRPDDRCDATKAWQYVDATGTLNSVAAVYNPIALGTPYANNPTSPAWCQGPGANFSGCTVGAYSTNGTSSMTLLTAAVPLVGQQIVCPFTSGGVLSTTISSISGTTVVLATAYPDTTAQAECFAGTSFQNIQTAIPATGRAFPITLTVANSLAPSPAALSNVAGVGVLKIGTEHFFYDSITRSVAGTNSFLVENSIENGTGATGPAHSVNDVVVPVNPFLLDSAEWAITPSINTGTTPPGAEPYPGFNVGNFGYGHSQADGTVGSGLTTFGSWFHKLIIEQWPVVNANPSNENNVADIYWGGGTPYSTSFQDLTLYGNYCYVQGGPGFNNYASNGSDGDGSRWLNNSCHATGHGAAVMITTGNQISASNWDIYGGGNGSYPSGAGFNVGGGFNDRTGPGSFGVGTGVSDSTFTNIYTEPGGTAYGNAAGMMVACVDCLWNDIHYSGGGDIVVGGTQNHFKGGDIGDFTGLPFVIYSSQSSFDHVYTYATKGANTYGASPFLNFGAQNTGCLLGGTSANAVNFSCQPKPPGFVTPPVGQTSETFAAGNTVNPFENSTESLFTADQFNQSNDLAGVWTFDSTIPWVTTGYQPCNVPAPASSNGCAVTLAVIGAGQRVVAGKTNIFFGAKQQSGSTQSLKFSIATASGGSCSGATLATFNIPLSTTWTVYNPGVVDLSAYAGCSLVANFYDSSSNTAAMQVQTAFVSAQPVPENITASQFTAAGSGTAATIFAGSGAPTGCGTTYANGSLYLNTAGTTGSMLYTCIGSTWTDIK